MTGGIGGQGGSFFGGTGYYGQPGLPGFGVIGGGSPGNLGGGGGVSLGAYGNAITNEMLRNYLKFGPLSPAAWHAMAGGGTGDPIFGLISHMKQQIWNPTTSRFENVGFQQPTYQQYVQNMAAARPAIAAYLSQPPVSGGGDYAGSATGLARGTPAKTVA
jgi:hypothetical protein